MSGIGSVLGLGGSQNQPPRQAEPAGQANGADSGNKGGDGGAGTGGVNETSETTSGGGAGAQGGGTGTGGGSGDGGGAAAQPSTGASAKLTVAPTATPYVAPPTVTADEVAEEAAARLDRAFAPDVDAAERARAFAEAAQDRQGVEALIAAIQPAPEGAPSLRGDAETVRGFAAASADGARRPVAA